MKSQEKHTSGNNKKIDDFDFCTKCRGRGGLTYPCDRCGKRVEC
jgi:predicted nucleic acid binding AN1-type Zn finger protein